MRGGIRKGSGRSKSGYFRGIYCASTYELVYVLFRLDHNLFVKRFEGFIKTLNSKYFPDFVDEFGCLIEIKGYYTPLVDIKINAALQAGYKTKVLYQQDLKVEFDWVKSNYQYKNIYELYDGYKPKYNYVCCNCSSEFSSDSKRKNKLIYCSKRCSLLGTATLNRVENSRKISKSLMNRPVIPYKRKYKQIWITNGSMNTRIKADSEIPIGFTRGRN
jgi:hypothetical protein